MAMIVFFNIYFLINYIININRTIIASLKKIKLMSMRNKVTSNMLINIVILMDSFLMEKIDLFASMFLKIVLKHDG